MTTPSDRIAVTRIFYFFLSAVRDGKFFKRTSHRVIVVVCFFLFVNEMNKDKWETELLNLIEDLLNLDGRVHLP